MSGDQDEFTVGIEAAWVRFRGRLADRLDELVEDECVQLTASTGGERFEGVSPYVQFVGWGEGLVRAETASNAQLAARYALDDEDDERLRDIGWRVPDDEEAGYHLDSGGDDADALSLMAARTLREVHGVVHPAFIDTHGLDRLPIVPLPPKPRRHIEPEEIATFPADRDELQLLVDAALAEMLLGSEVGHDDDGDVPIPAGQSVVFVRVRPDRAAVDLYAEIVVDVADLGRLPLEVDLLNARHPFAKFFTRDDRVAMTYQLCAVPFVPDLLRTMVGAVIGEIDELADDLARRVGGRRFLDLLDDEEDDVETEPEPDSYDEMHPSLVAIMEILHVRTLTAAAVASLFDHQRTDIVREIVRLRTGRTDCPDHDLELVLDHLRRGLSHLAHRAASREMEAERSRPRKPRSQQLSLMPNADQTTVDGEQWGTDAS